MIKFKKKMKYLKGFILYALLCVFAFMPFMSFNVNAWSLGSDGNLHSDNLLNLVDGDYSHNGISCIINNGEITLNGVANGNYLQSFTCYFESGQYTLSLFNNSICYDNTISPLDNNLRCDLRSQSGVLRSIYFDTINSYLTYTYTQDIYYFYIRIGSGLSVDNLTFSPMINSGSFVPNEYEPYDAIYYSQDNYNSVGYNILGGLESFDAINLYYSSSMTFVSTDGGNTYINANNQDVSNTLVTNSDGSRSLVINKDNPWGYLNYYYVHVDFSYPVFLWRLRILNAVKPTDFIKVVVNDREITKFNYKPNIDGSSYIVSDDIYQQTNSVDFYFRINGYTAEGNRSFVLGYDGYNVGVDSYRQGYEKGQEDLQPKIEALEDKVIMLSNDNENLRVQLGENFGWQNLFFTMADTPFYTISNMLNFEVLGLNLFQALIGFITIIAIVWILKRLVK